MSDIFTKEDEEILEYTRVVRRSLIKELTDDGKKVPYGKEDKALLASLLDGMDNNIVRTVKARTSIKELDQHAQDAQLVRSMLLERAKMRESKIINPEIPTVDTLEDELPIVEGENDIGIHQLTLDDLDLEIEA